MTPTSAEAVAGLVGEMRHLVSLNEPDKGGPYGGFAAQRCMAAMTKAASTLTSLAAEVEALKRERDEVRANEDDGLAWDALKLCKAELSRVSARLAEAERIIKLAADLQCELGSHYLLRAEALAFLNPETEVTK